MATRGFQDIPIKATVELIADGRTVGLAKQVPFLGRAFEYRHTRSSQPTIFRWADRHGTRGEYLSGYRFWEKQP